MEKEGERPCAEEGLKVSAESQEAEIQEERIGFEKMQKMHAEMMQAKELEHKQEVEMLKRQLEEARKHKELAGGSTGKQNREKKFLNAGI